MHDNDNSTYKPFQVTGSIAHQRPKKRLDFTRIIWAKDAVHAMDIYRRKLKGVKKQGLIQVLPLSLTENFE